METYNLGNIIEQFGITKPNKTVSKLV